MKTSTRLICRADEELLNYVKANPDIKLSDLESKMYEIAHKTSNIGDELAKLIAKEEDLTVLSNGDIRLWLYDDILRFLRLSVKVSTEFKGLRNWEGFITPNLI